MIPSVIGSPRVRVDLATQPYRGFADDHREAARPLQRNGKRAVGRLRYPGVTPPLGTRPLSLLVPDLVAKCVELLSQAVPDVARIAALWHPGDYGERTEANMIAGAEFAAQALGVRLRFYEVRGPQDFESTFARITATGSDALVVLGSN